jgi:hypothetical protein
MAERPKKTHIDIPYPGELVLAASDEHRIIRAPAHIAHSLVVIAKSLQNLEGRHLPDDDMFRASAASEHSPIVGKLNLPCFATKVVQLKGDMSREVVSIAEMIRV